MQIQAILAPLAGINETQMRFSKPAIKVRSGTGSTHPPDGPQASPFVGVMTWATAVLLGLCTFWACGALYFDLPWKGIGAFAATLYLCVVAAGLMIWFRSFWKAAGYGFACFAITV